MAESESESGIGSGSGSDSGFVSCTTVFSLVYRHPISYGISYCSACLDP